MFPRHTSLNYETMESRSVSLNERLFLVIRVAEEVEESKYQHMSCQGGGLARRPNRACNVVVYRVR